MTLFDIVEAIAHPDHTVSIMWSDGVPGVVDFLPIIDRGGWFHAAFPNGLSTEQ